MGPGRALLAVLILAGAAVAAQDDPKPPPGKPPEKKQVDDGKKKFLEGIGASLEKSDASAVGSHFKEKGKIDLRLRGIKEGKYRAKQARSLLASWMKKIEPEEVKLTDAKGSVGKFKTKYKVRADGKVHQGKLQVYLEKEGESWLITGIVES